MTDITIREGRPGDGAALAALFLRSRAAAMPWLPDLHTAAQTEQWLTRVVLAEQQVWVALVDGAITGFAALEGTWLEHLYIDPSHQGAGIGSRLLAEVKAAGISELRLYAFTRNVRAREFYEKADFVLVSESDGTDNEEHEPDCTYLWRRATPSS